MTVASRPLLSTELLEKLRSRAAGYDRDNRFFQEDFEDLRAAGYLKMAVPRELGGLGLNLRGGGATKRARWPNTRRRRRSA